MERFDGAAAWAALGLAEKDAIGRLALELVSTWIGLDKESPGSGNMTLTPAARALETAGVQLTNHLEDYVAGVVPALSAKEPARIPLLLGQVCHVCGCSQEDACAPELGGCHWVGEDLCSGCAGTPLHAPRAA